MPTTACLLQFAKREGHSRVPTAYRDDDGYKLGQWVSNQRANRQDGRISDERQQLLEALPGWTWDVREAAWEDGYGRVLQFAKREGHSRVPTGYRDRDGYQLRGWVNEQRFHQRHGKLSDERRQRLEALPGWAWDSREAAWDDAYARLRSFAEREGHSRVLRLRHPEDDGFRLDLWVHTQRTLHRRGRLSEDKKQRLEALPGWVWDTQKAAWEEAYNRLLQFADGESHSRVPVAYRDDDGFRLGQWVNVQRTNRGRGRLSEERQRRLEAVPGWVWDARKAGEGDDA